MTLGESQDIERGLKVQGVEDDKTSPYEKQAFSTLLTNCLFQEDSKILPFLSKRIKSYSLRKCIEH